MAEGADKESKTEEATEKKDRDTIEKGKLPHSREVALFASFVAILVFIVFYARDAIVGLGMFLSVYLEKPEDWPIDRGADVILLYRIVISEIGKPLAMLLILLATAGIGASVFQNTPQFVGGRIRPQLSRISIAPGWERVLGLQGCVGLLRPLAKRAFSFA